MIMVKSEINEILRLRGYGKKESLKAAKYILKQSKMLSNNSDKTEVYYQELLLNSSCPIKGKYIDIKV